MYIRITKKLAQTLNGLDLRAFEVGEVVDLPHRFATMLMTEGWAEAVRDQPGDTSEDRPSRQRRRGPARD